MMPLRWELLQKSKEKDRNKKIWGPLIIVAAHLQDGPPVNHSIGAHM